MVWLSSYGGSGSDEGVGIVTSENIIYITGWVVYHHPGLCMCGGWTEIEMSVFPVQLMRRCMAGWLAHRSTQYPGSAAADKKTYFTPSQVVHLEEGWGGGGRG